MAAEIQKILNLSGVLEEYVVLHTQSIQNLPEMAYSVIVFEINDIFHFYQKFKMVAKSGKSLNFSEVLVVLSFTHGVQNLPRIVLSVTVFEINNFFQNSRWWPKFRKF